MSVLYNHIIQGDDTNIISDTPPTGLHVPDTNVGELISRKNAIDVLNRGLSKIPYVNNTDTEMIRRDERIGCIQEIRELPSVQQKKGKWIYGEHESTMCDGYRCDNCGFFVPWDYQHKFIDFIKDYNYCPSCGAKMEVKND